VILLFLSNIKWVWNQILNSFTIKSLSISAFTIKPQRFWFQAAGHWRLATGRLLLAIHFTVSGVSKQMTEIGKQRTEGSLGPILLQLLSSVICLLTSVL
jgi:hypothetical protein